MNASSKAENMYTGTTIMPKKTNSFIHLSFTSPLPLMPLFQ